MDMEDSKVEQNLVEVVDLADSPMLRPKPARGRPPGSGRAKLIEAITDDSFEGLSAHRINGRPTKAGRGERSTPSRVNTDKPIFTLSVAAEILALHPRTLRIYEEHGLVVPHRTQTQRRRYSQNDIKKFQFIQFLTQKRRVNLEGVKIILAMLDDLGRLGVGDPIRHTFADYKEAE